MSKELEAYYGLPSKVKFCKKCVISNQRPSSTIELGLWFETLWTISVEIFVIGNHINVVLEYNFIWVNLIRIIRGYRFYTVVEFI